MNEFSPNRHYPLPHPDHLLAEDVFVLREAITAIDADVTAQAAATRQLGAHQDGQMKRQRLRVFHHFDF